MCGVGVARAPDVVWVAPGPLPEVLLIVGADGSWGYPLGAGWVVRARRVVRAERASGAHCVWADRCRMRRRAVVTRCPARENRRSRRRLGSQRRAG